MHPKPTILYQHINYKQININVNRRHFIFQNKNSKNVVKLGWYMLTQKGKNNFKQKYKENNTTSKQKQQQQQQNKKRTEKRRECAAGFPNPGSVPCSKPMGVAPKQDQLSLSFPRSIK